VPGADISLHLARHGVKAEIERTGSADLPFGEVPLSRVADLGADLLVMGAYGHSRARVVTRRCDALAAAQHDAAGTDVALSHSLPPE
jgi:hypothetical protein